MGRSHLGLWPAESRVTVRSGSGGRDNGVGNQRWVWLFYDLFSLGSRPSARYCRDFVLAFVLTHPELNLVRRYSCSIEADERGGRYGGAGRWSRAYRAGNPLDQTEVASSSSMLWIRVSQKVSCEHACPFYVLSANETSKAGQRGLREVPHLQQLSQSQLCHTTFIHLLTYSLDLVS